MVINSNTQQHLIELEELCDNHSLWENPLFKACQEGLMTINDFKFLFSQYYFYSKNFSKLIAAMMVQCDNDYYRSKLAQNLWEESGEKDIAKRHAEIFRSFLIDGLNISLNKIYFEDFTQQFSEEYLNFCLKSPAIESSAALALGTESIVSRMYKILRYGLIKAGVDPSKLIFFDIHIECDDEHAETIQEIMISYSTENNWLERSKSAINFVMDLRHRFFNQIYERIMRGRLDGLIKSIAYKPEQLSHYNNLLYNTSFTGNQLYSNDNKSNNISFKVERIPVPGDVMDPRVVTIPPGQHNEYHEHAHETIFLILKGCGEVIIEDTVIHIKENDIIYVPRWLKHQTHNTGQFELKFFAVTDYGLTRRFPLNTESCYRLNKEAYATEPN